MRAKAAEGCRTPGRFARHEAHETTHRVLECSSPLELFPREPQYTLVRLNGAVKIKIELK
jgi:hypothetical protein